MISKHRGDSANTAPRTSERIKLWSRVTGLFATAGAVVGVAMSGARSADELHNTEMVRMQVKQGDNADLSGIARNALEFVQTQAENSVITSLAVGAVALSGLAIAARLARKLQPRREAREMQRHIAAQHAAERAAEQATRIATVLHNLTLIEDWQAYYSGRARVLEINRPKTIDEMTPDEQMDLLVKRKAEPQGDGMYRSLRSLMERDNAYTANGRAATATVAEAGDVQLEYRSPQGYYYLKDVPTHQYPLVPQPA